MIDLNTLYGDERVRLSLLSQQTDSPQADYLNPVFGVGNEHPLLMIIGEAPGKDEANEGIPFIGKAGKQLDSFLMEAGIDRAQVFVTNAVKYRPINRKANSISNRTPTKAEILGSLHVLKDEIAILSPGVIATFGNTPLYAVQEIAGDFLPSGTVGELHGKKLPFKFNGKAMILFPMYHPASVIYNNKLRTVIEDDTRNLAKLTLSIEQ